MRVHVVRLTDRMERLTKDVNNIVDYSMKTVKWRKVDYDNAIILPRSWGERFSGY
jgi:hypothetical protein